MLLRNVGSKCYGNCIFNLLSNSRVIADICGNSRYRDIMGDFNANLRKHDIFNHLQKEFNFNTIYYDSDDCKMRANINGAHFMIFMHELFCALSKKQIIKNRLDNFFDHLLKDVYYFSSAYFLHGDTEQRPVDDMFSAVLMLLDFAMQKRTDQSNDLFDPTAVSTNLNVLIQANAARLSRALFLSKCFFEEKSNLYEYTMKISTSMIITSITDDFGLNFNDLLQGAQLGGSLICIQWCVNNAFTAIEANNKVENFDGLNLRNDLNANMKKERQDKIKSIILKMHQFHDYCENKHTNIDIDREYNKIQNSLQSLLNNSNTQEHKFEPFAWTATALMPSVLPIIPLIYSENFVESNANLYYNAQPDEYKKRAIYGGQYVFACRDANIPIKITANNKNYRLTGVTYRKISLTLDIGKLRSDFNMKEAPGSTPRKPKYTGSKAGENWINGHYNTVNYLYDDKNKLINIQLVDDYFNVTYTPKKINDLHVDGVDGQIVIDDRDIFMAHDPPFCNGLCGQNPVDELATQNKKINITEYETPPEDGQPIGKITSVLASLQDSKIFYPSVIHYYKNAADALNTCEFFYKSMTLKEYLYINNSYPVHFLYEICE